MLSLKLAPTKFFISPWSILLIPINRRSLWSSLKSFQNAISTNNEEAPWAVLGDFNVTLKLNESKGGSSAIKPGTLEFKDYVSGARLTDLSFTRDFFTWWDNNKSHPIQCKLDRVLVNDSWMNMFLMSRAEFRSMGLSNHSLAMVFLDNGGKKLKKPFEIFHHIISSSNLFDVVSK